MIKEAFSTERALKHALEALESWGKGFPNLVQDIDKQAITAIKQALAAQRNPLWLATHPNTLVATSPNVATPLAAQRTWVALTDDEIDDIMAYANPHCNETEFARAIEAKLKAKNETIKD